jgi:hypothetical protein
MRKISLALAAIVAVSFAAPAMAKTVIIKKGHDHHAYGMEHHGYGMHRGFDHHHGGKKIIIKKGD